MKIELRLTTRWGGKSGRGEQWEEFETIEAPTRLKLEQKASAFLSDWQQTQEGKEVHASFELVEESGGVTRWTTWRVRLAATNPNHPVVTVPDGTPFSVVELRQVAREQTRAGIQPFHCPGCGQSLQGRKLPFCSACFGAITPDTRKLLEQAYNKGMGRSSKRYRDMVRTSLNDLIARESGGGFAAPVATEEGGSDGVHAVQHSLTLAG